MNKPSPAPFELLVTNLAAGGKGIGRNNGKVIFVDKGIPGQRVSVQLYKERKDYAEGRVVEVLENSPVYMEPRCSHFTMCGGCSLQNMRYTEQLAYKRQWIAEALQRIAGIDDITIQETIPSPDLYFYRNKMEFSFSDKIWDPSVRKIQPGSYGLGLHLPGRYDTVIMIDNCYLQSSTSNRIVRLVREHAGKSGLPAYNIQKHRGFWRFLIIREGKLTGERLVNIITYRSGEEEKSIVDALADTLRNEIPDVTAFYHAEHSGKSQAATWESMRKIYGSDFIHERIGRYLFRIDCGTFFQTNSRQAENLYKTVKTACNFSGSEIVYDLFSGAGTIPVYLSDSAGTIAGMEREPLSVAAANANAALNNVTNCHFIQGSVSSLIKYPPELFKRFGKPDVIIVDPPRSGVDKKSIERITQLKARRIVYVSCNPATLARDIKLLLRKYIVENVVPVDMFPHTAHIESVTTLIRKITG